MLFSLITNDVTLAVAAERCGIERILLDLERHGKAERQAGRALFLSNHQHSDVARLAEALDSAQLVVRINPWHAQSPEEIELLLESGAQALMLPYFHSPQPVEAFLEQVGSRALPILLLETWQGAQHLETLIALAEQAGAELHIGLNDMALSLGHTNFWAIIADGTIANLAHRIAPSGVPFGIGGVGHLSHLELPVNPEGFLAYQSRLGATRGWLGRSFRQLFTSPDNQSHLDVPILRREVARLHERADYWCDAPPAVVEQMEKQFYAQVGAVVSPSS